LNITSVSNLHGTQSHISKQHTSGNDQAEKDAGADVDEKLKDIKSIGDDKGPIVIDNLLRAVSDVKPVVPDRVEQPVA